MTCYHVPAAASQINLHVFRHPQPQQYWALLNPQLSPLSPRVNKCAQIPRQNSQDVLRVKLRDD